MLPITRCASFDELIDLIVHRHRNSDFASTVSNSKHHALFAEAMQPYFDNGCTVRVLGDAGRGLVFGVTPPHGTPQDEFILKFQRIEPNAYLNHHRSVRTKQLPDILSGGPAHHLAYRTLKAITTEYFPPELMKAPEILAQTPFAFAVTSMPRQAIETYKLLRPTASDPQPDPAYLDLARTSEAGGITDMDWQFLDIAHSPTGPFPRIADRDWQVLSTPPVESVYAAHSGNIFQPAATSYNYNPATGNMQLEFADHLRAHEQHRLAVVITTLDNHGAEHKAVYIPTIPGEGLTLGALAEHGVITCSPAELLDAMGITALVPDAVTIETLPPLPAKYYDATAAASTTIRTNEFREPRGFITREGPLLTPLPLPDRAGNIGTDTLLEWAEHATEEPAYLLQDQSTRKAYLMAGPSERPAMLRQHLEAYLKAEHTGPFRQRLYQQQLEAMDAGYSCIAQHRAALGLGMVFTPATPETGTQDGNLLTRAQPNAGMEGEAR